jgi:hypothetical protein
MVTDSLMTYGHWNLTLPICQPRSRLYSLQPIGIGTPHVESLTGYVARLADAHCVQPGSLIAREFTSLVKQPNGQTYLHGMSSRTEALNGSGQMALEFVQTLERLTLRDDLYYLTLLLWAEVIPARGLLRRIRAWCPSCYEEWQTNSQTVYEPLLWDAGSHYNLFTSPATIILKMPTLRSPSHTFGMGLSTWVLC